jgi:hypothetical protein
MQKQVFVKAVIIMLALASCIRADVSVIVNGGFEDDESIDDIIVQEPNGWDVNLPVDEFGIPKFGGYVLSDWVQEGNYNLTLFSNEGETFDGNTAMVSQQVNLRDINQIFFDIRLDTYSASSSEPWDPNKCAAVVLIDDEVVWESNDVGPDVRDEYLHETVDVSGKYGDRGLHKLSIGMRVSEGETPDFFYFTDWDSIRFDLHCGDFGFLDGDFTRDCYVDANDLRLLAQVWLQEVDPYDKCNLFSDDDLELYGVINFHDFAVYSETWDGNTADLKNFVDVWLGEVEPNNIYNLFSADDLEPNGVINFFDFAVFTEDWERSSYD